MAPGLAPPASLSAAVAPPGCGRVATETPHVPGPRGQGLRAQTPSLAPGQHPSRTAQPLSGPLPRAGVTGVYPASSPLLLFLSVALKERLVCATAAAPGPGRPSSRLSRWGACSPVPPWVLARARQGKRGWARGGGRHSVPNTEPGGALKPQDSRARCAWPGPSSGLCHLGPGCGPWRRLGPEPQYFKPLVPMQLPNLLSVQAAATPAVHTGTHMPDTRPRPGTRPHRGAGLPSEGCGASALGFLRL